MSAYFVKLGQLSKEAGSIISILNLGLEGQHGAVTIRASKRGMAIMLNGRSLLGNLAMTMRVEETNDLAVNFDCVRNPDKSE